MGGLSLIVETPDCGVEDVVRFGEDGPDQVDVVLPDCLRIFFSFGTAEVASY